MPRKNIPSQIVVEESSWGFGQIVPLLLLALPLVTMSEAFYGQ